MIADIILYLLRSILYLALVPTIHTIQSGGGSFLSNNTDDDDISIFVQEIDARKPLSGHQRIRSRDRGAGGSSSRSPSSRVEQPIAGLLSTDEQDESSGPMLTSESEVDERLRRMNLAFMESLEGLGGGGGRRRERRSSSSKPGMGGEGDDGSDGRSSEPDALLLGRMSTEGSRSRDSGGSGGGGVMGRGRGFVLPPTTRPRVDSRSTSDVNLGGVQGSDEVLGRLSLDDERRRSRGQ
jgi:autophagy-related protein 13